MATANQPHSLPWHERIAPIRTMATQMRGWIAGILIVWSAYLVFLALDHRPERQYVVQAMLTGCYLITGIAFLLAIRRISPGLLRRAWLFLGIAFVCNAIGEVIYSYYELVLNIQQPFPTVADAFYLLFYPIAAIGVIFIPSGAVSANGRVRVSLDTVIIALAVLGLTFYYLIWPIYQQHDTPILTQMVSIGYPLGDFFVITTVILLTLRGMQRNILPLAAWIVLGMLMYIYADTVYWYQTNLNIYIDGTLYIDGFWPLGSLLILIAPLYHLVQQRASVQEATRDDPHVTENFIRTDSLPRSLIPYLPLGIFAFLLHASRPANLNDELFRWIGILAIVVVLVIITRQVVTMGELVDARIARQRSEQINELKNEFIASVNHELRTPLMALQTYTDVLSAQFDRMDHHRQQQMITKMAQTTHSLVELVESILDIRTINEQRPPTIENIGMRQAIDDVLSLLPDAIQQRQDRELHLTVAPDTLIQADRIRLQQILLNLLTNAVKYSDPGTPIAITVGPLTDTVRMSLPRAMRARADLVDIQVSDKGWGIPPDAAPLLFQQFVRLPRDIASTVKGNGLGLYLCRVYAESMNGLIWVESSGVRGEGSTFHLVMPQSA